jgi:hypothetical protein
MALDKHAKQFVAAWAVVLSLASVTVSAEQAVYGSPEAAVQALVDAAGSTGGGALEAVLGPQVKDLLYKDPAENAAARARFAAAAAEATHIERSGDDRATLVVGAQAWPFPIPLVRDARGWRFDTAAGKDEIINRRIGRNELHTLATVRAYVEAQFEYASRDWTGTGAGQYAQRLRSTEGLRDGLYWPSAQDEPESPLGPLVAAAVKAGYTRAGSGGVPSPFHGYYYRVLTGQGAHAPGGALSYLEAGRMTGGFALIAWPAEYGRSGVMTFIVNAQGIVFQKDLGEDTERVAASITDYDPGPDWTPVADD